MSCELGLQPGLCIGPLPIRFYGIIIVLGALIGGFVAAREARRRGENPDRIWDALVYVVIAGIVGARIYHILSTPAGCAPEVPMCGWPWYQNHPLDMLLIWNGGLGIFGAIVAGGLVVLLYTRRNKLSLARYLDIAAPGLIIGQAIGRWGNFLNQELYGPPTDLPWGILIDAPHRYGEYADLAAYPADLTYFHPLFLYESMLNVLGFIVLVVAARRWRKVKDGDLILIYMIWYGFVRLVVESFRFDAWVVADGGLPAAQLISLMLMALGAGLLAVRHVRRNTASIA
jgi:phosphatidylglycerol:prolipoprotein diacylglycerol transferase